MAGDGLGLKDLEKWQRENYLGKEVRELQIPEPFLLDSCRIKSYCDGLSDDNPLFCDPAYASDTRWGVQLAPPSITSALRYPQAHSGLYDKSWKVTNFVGGNEREWFGVFRSGDKYRTNLVLKDLYIKHGSKGDLLFMVTEGGLWNQDGELVAVQHGTQIQVAVDVNVEATKDKEQLFYKTTEPYKYSKEEIEEITAAYDSEMIRGGKTLYWEDVNVGDKLPRIARGPLTIADQMRYRAANFAHAIGEGYTFKVAYKMGKNTQVFGLTTNPATNWPYESAETEHDDLYLVRSRGLGLPFDRGIQRCEMAGTLVTNWMGDDGFLRRMGTQVRRPCFYGDTTWFSGEVVKKYKVTEGEVEYGAVDIRIDGKNQVGDLTLVGTATIYLPSRERQVTVPIPVKVDLATAVE